ncbi:MAG: response regulator [Gammaproteobacteria bacterium]|nr:response regulator [Gammaproteobacteria bacterium]
MQNKKTILLVEDNPDDEELTRIALNKSGVANHIIVARDGVQALDVLFKENRNPRDPSNEMPVVMLLDLKLPKLDGIEVLRRVRADQRTRPLPVVVLTTSKEQQDIVATYQLGVNSYIHKPVDFERFTEAVRQLGLYWLLLNEDPWQALHAT